VVITGYVTIVECRRVRFANVTIVECRRVRFAKEICRVREIRNTYKILLGIIYIKLVTI